MRSSIVDLYTSMNCSEMLQNILIDSVFYGEYKPDVELWFRVRNETQNNESTFDNNVGIYQFFRFDPFYRPGIK